MKYNTAYQPKIILRMFNEDTKAMDEFHEKYTEARIYNGQMKKPTATELAIAKSWASTGPKHTASKFGISTNSVQMTVSRVAKYQMKYGK
jgi:hypothetical protein